ncbi:histidinol-phosphatase (PHP family) [Halolactibacillus halophilus]|uniref:Histidinol-phosphatase n=1 Tax=Halolactibacillus halophilus TaxID=306540 RepID=A0A1I5NGG3_9BACI|nr:histidinol-phosphatase HisJ [Halolactibacillus halophilus]GEM01319.1 histidinol-phosphatase [Halolactibacillus halophilus]SFP20780.1 histidinol-phosphatase (PHP family) [Halolactibacillus halophilus]
MPILGDYHIHTPFCPHGTTDTLAAYAEKAIQLGLKEISFTEHAPLPEGFVDPTPDKDSGMRREQVDAYIKAIQKVREMYKNDLKIRVGFEVDYIEGFEQATTDFLNTYGDEIEDAILSVHMLKDNTDTFHCLDFSQAAFGDLVTALGSVENVYRAYFHTVEKSVRSDLGHFKPIRIGHMTLVEKFKRVYPYQYSKVMMKQIDQLLTLIKTKGYQLDVNTAGLFKPDCQTVYPNPVVLQRAKENGIPLKIGSDAHQATDVGREFQIALID